MGYSSNTILSVLGDLERAGLPLKSARALELFAREGDWHTIHYAPTVGTLECWEIDPRFETALRQNLPKATIRIQDSIKAAHNPAAFGQFDLVVVDNPQGLFGPNGEYCEHFDVLRPALSLLAPNSGILFNVNLSPHSLADKPAWADRRKRFYEMPDPLDLPTALDFYRRLVSHAGFEVAHATTAPRNERIHYVGLLLKR